MTIEEAESYLIAHKAEKVELENEFDRAKSKLMVCFNTSLPAYVSGWIDELVKVNFNQNDLSNPDVQSRVTLLKEELAEFKKTIIDKSNSFYNSPDWKNKAIESAFEKSYINQSDGIYSIVLHTFEVFSKDITEMFKKHGFVNMFDYRYFVNSYKTPDLTSIVHDLNSLGNRIYNKNKEIAIDEKRLEEQKILKDFSNI